ncbi:hypothetical protein CR513_36791, partial [Mucuna pruriens]
MKSKVDEEKVKVIQDWLTPKIMGENICKGFSTLATHLNETMKKRVGTKWEESQERAFQALKEKLTQALFLIGGAQLNYSTYDQKLYALVKTFDHKALKYLRGKGKLNKRHAKWVEFLEQFLYVIKHKQGKMNVVMDALSRRHALIAMLETKMLGLDYIKEFEPFPMCVHSAFHDFFRHDEFLFKGKRLCSPMSSIWQLLHFYCPRIRKSVHNICERYLTCKLTKSKVSPHGLRTLLPIPTSPWIDISIDFILGLPRFSKIAHLIPCYNSYDASYMANIFFRDVVRLHGLPRTIISDKDTKFYGDFWKSLWSRIGTKLLFPPLVIHKWMDKLRVWEDWIRQVKFSYNRMFNSTTSYSPFELTYSFNPLSPLDLFPLSILPNFGFPKPNFLKGTIANGKERRKICKKCKHGEEGVFFKEGHLVWVYLRKERFSHLRKFTILPRGGDPFKILKKINDNAYKFKMPQEFGEALPLMLLI